MFFKKKEETGSLRWLYEELLVVRGHPGKQVHVLEKNMGLLTADTVDDFVQ